MCLGAGAFGLLLNWAMVRTPMWRRWLVATWFAFIIPGLILVWRGDVKNPAKPIDNPTDVGYSYLMPATHTFQVGTTYSTRSNGDHNMIWSFEVIKRTAKFVTIRSASFATGGATTGTARVGVRTWGDSEWASPFGTYSLAPVIRADRSEA